MRDQARSVKQQRADKTVADSSVVISQLMRPQHANFAGNVHGGVILGLMDEAAYLCGSRFAETYCVTVAVDHVDFQSPILVGDMVTLRASVNSTGRSSMEVGISMTAENPTRPGSVRRTNRSYFTMVAVDGDRRTVTVPTLKCETDQDRLWKCEADLRRELRTRFNEELEAGRCRFEPAAVG